MCSRAAKGEGGEGAQRYDGCLPVEELVRIEAERPEAGARTNAQLSGNLLDEIAAPDADGLALLRQAADTLSLSARGFHRTLRVARTLADLEASPPVLRHHIAEALSYRREVLRQGQTKAA